MAIINEGTIAKLRRLAASWQVSTISWVIGAAVGAFAMYKGYKWWLANVKNDGTVS